VLFAWSEAVTFDSFTVTPMEDIQSLKKLLNQINELDSVTDALLMTKTGMFILGSLRRSTQLDKFAGMSAILMGSSEAMAMEMKDPIVGSVIRLSNQKIVFASLTEDIVLAVIFHGKRQAPDLLNDVNLVIASQ
jgi:predicted regulator of Ras-like GTPase activity (Roadblock/LC7/MglB family)